MKWLELMDIVCSMLCRRKSVVDPLIGCLSIPRSGDYYEAFFRASAVSLKQATQWS